MLGIFETAERLALLLKNSEYYKEYTSAKAAVDAEPEYREAILRYKRLQSRSVHSPGQSSAENERTVSEAYYDMTRIETIRRFLEAEQKIVGLICGVLETVAAAAPVEIWLPDEKSAPDGV